MTPSVYGLEAAAVWQRAIFEKLSGKAEESLKIRVASLRLKAAKLPPMSDKNKGGHSRAVVPPDPNFKLCSLGGIQGAGIHWEARGSEGGVLSSGWGFSRCFSETRD